MSDPVESRLLVTKVLQNNKIEIHKLKMLVGNSLRPMLGTPDGFYALDLSLPMDRHCLTLLFEVSKTVAKSRSQLHAQYFGPCFLGDVSQWGNWSCFRNEVLNGVPVLGGITVEQFIPMPRSGKFCFDFSSASYQRATVSSKGSRQRPAE